MQAAQARGPAGEETCSSWCRETPPLRCPTARRLPLCSFSLLRPSFRSLLPHVCLCSQVAVIFAALTPTGIVIWARMKRGSQACLRTRFRVLFRSAMRCRQGGVAGRRSRYASCARICMRTHRNTLMARGRTLRDWERRLLRGEGGFLASFCSCRLHLKQRPSHSVQRRGPRHWTGPTACAVSVAPRRRLCSNYTLHAVAYRPSEPPTLQPQLPCTRWPEPPQLRLRQSITTLFDAP